MIFKPTVAAAEGAPIQPLQLLPGLEFHMYMSAQPCGALCSWLRLRPTPGCANPFAVFAGSHDRGSDRLSCAVPAPQPQPLTVDKAGSRPYLLRGLWAEQRVRFACLDFYSGRRFDIRGAV